MTVLRQQILGEDMIVESGQSGQAEPGRTLLVVYDGLMSFSNWPFRWRYPFREVSRRPVRALLTLIGIVLGVASVTAVQLALDATTSTYRHMYQVTAGRADLDVLPGSSQDTLPAETASLKAVPGVEVVVPLVRSTASLLTSNGPVPVLVLGITLPEDAKVRDRDLIEGHDLQGPDQILLESEFARRHGLEVGARVSLRTGPRMGEYTLAGLLANRGVARFRGGAIALLPLPAARELFNVGERVHALQVVVAAGSSPETVRQRIEARFPDQHVEVAGAPGDMARDFLLSIEQALRSMSAVAIVAGALVILNTFLMNLGERQRQLALLRAVGATGAQVTGLLVRQALLLGMVGTLIGMPLGIVLARGILRVLEWVLEIDLPAWSVAPQPLVQAGLLGPVMTLIATLGPARRAASRPLLGDLRGRFAPLLDRPPRLLPLFGAGLIGFILVCVGLIVFQAVPFGWGTSVLPLFVAGCLVGTACCLPALVPFLLGLCRVPVGFLLGIEGKVAVRQLERHRERTALTVGVLFAALTAALAFGTSFANNLRDIELWFVATIDAPYLIRAGRPDPTLAMPMADVPDGTREAIARFPSVKGVGRIRLFPLRVHGIETLVLARDFPVGRPLSLHLLEGEAEEVLAGLQRGETVIGSPLAARLGLKRGDQVTLPSRDGPHRVRIAGVIKEYSVGGMAFYLEWRHAQQIFGIVHANVLSVDARPDAGPALGEQLARYCRAHGLYFQPQDEFGNLIRRVATGVQGLMLVVGMMIGMVACVGVVNTLLANILDQTRELGLLRALGMKRGQIRKLILAQALTLAMASSLIGLPTGLFVALLMNLCMPGLLGHQVTFRFEPWVVFPSVLALFVLTVFASLFPARRAMFLSVHDALRDE